MANENNNLASNAPKVFKDSSEPTFPDIPMDELANEVALNAIAQDTENLANDKVADTQLNLLYTQFVVKLKEFIETQADPTSVKEELEDILEKIYSNVQSTNPVDESTIAQSVSEISETDVYSEDTTSLQIDLDNEFVKEITESILNIINFNTVVNATIKHTVEMVKSLIDANAEAFKQALNDEMTKGLELVKFTQISNEKGEETIIPADVENEGETNAEDEAGVQPQTEISSLPETPKPEEEQTPESEEQNQEGESSQQEKPTEEKEGQDKQPKEEKPGEDKKNDPNSNIVENQKLLDLQRKRKLLGIDKTLNEVNQQLKKLIEQQDVVEEYKPREDEEESEVSGKKEKSKSDKKETDKEDLEKESEEDEEEKAAARENRKNLGKGLLLGSLAVALVALRGYRTHAVVQNYVKAHANDSMGQLQSTFHSEIENTNGQINFDEMDSDIAEQTTELSSTLTKSDSLKSDLEEAESESKNESKTQVEDDEEFTATANELNSEQQGFYTEDDDIELPTIKIEKPEPSQTSSAIPSSQPSSDEGIPEVREGENDDAALLSEVEAFGIEPANAVVPPPTPYTVPKLPEERSMDFEQQKFDAVITEILNGSIDVPSTSIEAIDSILYRNRANPEFETEEETEESATEIDSEDPEVKKWTVRRERFRTALDNAERARITTEIERDLLIADLEAAQEVLLQLSTTDPERTALFYKQQANLLSSEQAQIDTSISTMLDASNLIAAGLEEIKTEDERKLTQLQDAVATASAIVEDFQRRVEEVPDETSPNVIYLQLEEPPKYDVEQQDVRVEPEIVYNVSVNQNVDVTLQQPELPQDNEIEDENATPPESISDVDVPSTINTEKEQIQIEDSQIPSEVVEPNIDFSELEASIEALKLMTETPSDAEIEQFIADNFNLERFRELNHRITNDDIAINTFFDQFNLTIDNRDNSITIKREQMDEFYKQLHNTYLLLARIAIAKSQSLENVEVQDIIKSMHLQLDN